MAGLAGKRVLIVNDDGIDGTGIKLLETMMRRFTDDVWVVAPDEERSGASHSISVSHPIRARQLDERHYAVRGSPTDCALLGIYTVMKDGRRPDILLSGINNGPNLAEDVHYSGTCAAAKEGAVLGIPSVALSQMRSYGHPAHWETSETLLPQIVEKLLGTSWVAGTFVNVNVPNIPADEVSGIEVTRLGRRPPGGFMPVQREDERFVPYYWIKICPQEGGDLPGTDLEAVGRGAVSITPMHLDLTCDPLVAALKQNFA